jgi:type III secretory pathway lipoprotein EscJ
MRSSLLALLLLASCQGDPVCPEPSAARQPGAEEILSGSLLPGRDEQLLRREHALAGEIAGTLASLPGVADARVHLSLADRSVLSRDRQARSGAAVILVTDGAGGPGEGDVRRILTAAIPGLEGGDIEVLSRPAADAGTELVEVGPLTVHRRSAGLARGLMAGLLIACLALAAGLVFAGLRIRRLKEPAGGDA